jgi:hypothetical protein
MYTLETDLDKLPIAELKRLALVAIKVQIRSRVKSKEYYERHGEKSRERTIRNYALKKAARMEAEQINHETEE